MTETGNHIQDPNTPVKSVDGYVILRVAPDRMEAEMELKPPVGDGGPVTLEKAHEELKMMRVIHGVMHDIIEQKINQNVHDQPFTCAKGTSPVDGEDGKVIYHFNVENQKTPSISKDGTVDFKNLDLIENVRSGDLIAEQILPTEGTPGKDVQGHPVQQKPGRPALFKPGKFTELSQDTLQIHASTDGQALLRDGKITVSPVYQVPANVDNTTGNIRFNGKVAVKGNVKSGFTIEADGDIEVTGVVEGAVLKSNGNIILNRGVQGNNQAELYCKGDLVSKYIENTKINVGGSVQADCILHSIVYAKKRITIQGKKGLIVGGVVKAGEEIASQIIGSSMGTQTRIEVGIDPDLKEKYDQAKEKLQETMKNLTGLKQTIEVLNKMNQKMPLPQAKKEMLVRSVKTYEVMKDDQVRLQELIQGFDSQMANATKGKVHVSSVIYPGVKVGIHNAVKHVYDDLAMCTLYYRDGEIAIGLYEK